MSNLTKRNLAGRYRPGESLTMRSITYKNKEYLSMDFAIEDKTWRRIFTTYRQTVNEKKKELSVLLMESFQRPVFFKECQLTDLALGVKNLEKKTGYSLPVVINHLATYLEKDCSFLICRDRDKLPLNCEKIIEGYCLTMLKAPIEEVENALKS